MFALIDANSFYASCEAVFEPQSRNKPLIVLTNNDGCVCALNRQAKALGIPKFSPYFKIKHLCDKHNVIVRSSNYELYSNLSSKMMTILSRYSDNQYIYSIDESFLKFDNYDKAISNWTDYGRGIRRTIYKETRLPVCVGFGPSVTLAKAANHGAKNIKGYRGVAVIDDEKSRRYILENMEVGEVWGIGRKISAKLKLDNIQTAWDLSNVSPQLARRYFNIEVEKTVRELNGEACINWSEARTPKKQIYSTRSFGYKVTCNNELRESLAQHATTVAEKLRRQGSLVSTLHLFAASSPFGDSPVRHMINCNLVVPSNDTSVLVGIVCGAIDKLFVSGVKYHNAGVGAIVLVNSDCYQHDLFNQSTDNPKLMQALDDINSRYGRNTMSFAAGGFDNKWSMKRAYLSPNYTGSWGELVKIRC